MLDTGQVQALLHHGSRDEKAKPEPQSNKTSWVFVSLESSDSVSSWEEIKISSHCQQNHERDMTWYDKVRFGSCRWLIVTLWQPAGLITLRNKLRSGKKVTVSDLRFRYCLGVSFMTLQDLGLDRARYSSWEPPPKDTCQQKFEICESFFNCFQWGWGLFGSHKRVQSVLVIWYCIKLIKIVVWAVGSRSVMAFGMQVAVRMHWFEWDFRASTLTTLTAPGSWSTKPAHLYKVRSLAEPCGALLFLLFWFWTDLWGRDTHHEVSHGLITDGVFMNIVWQCLTCLHPFPSTKDLQEFYGRCMIL